MLERLNPLRFHMEELLTEMESHNHWARAVAKATGKPPILLREDKIKAARKAQAEAEKVIGIRQDLEDNQVGMVTTQ
jgi:hypothetical protein